MEKLNLKIITVGSRKAPAGWHIFQRTKMQRLYYIKSGTGWMQDEQGNKAPFEAGKIYIHPYNIVADFISDPDDPIDHIYYDFLSTPPIISDAPIIYDLPGSSAAVAIMQATEAVCTELINKGVAGKEDNYVPPYMLNKSSEFGHIFKNLLSITLELLDRQKTIPFSADAFIIDTLEAIRQNYMKPISVNTLAEAAGFEVHHFIRRFKQTMGMTPFAYLRAYRLIKAKELIDNGMPITKAAAYVGYDSPTALSRALKRDG
jgi:AraC-like DNA-binding protein